jgi:tRNA pseudouridine55 synthase
VDLDGILLINKEVGRTSFETVQLVKGKIGVKKAGHTGTLDKSASGLLLVCVNRATSIQGLLTNQFKRYQGTVRFGVETDTLDNDGHTLYTGPAGRFSTARIRGVLKEFQGKILQIPPLYSAIHKDGERMHRLARSGRTVHVEPREVEIKELKLLQNSASSIRIDATVSSGTYIRSLARDIAASLGTCGYLSQLHRMSIGSFSVEQSSVVDDIDESTPLLSMVDALGDFPQLEIDDERTQLVRNGVPVTRVLHDMEGKLPHTGNLCLVNAHRLVAIVEMKQNPVYVKVFAPVKK